MKVTFCQISIRKKTKNVSDNPYYILNSGQTDCVGKFNFFRFKGKNFTPVRSDFNRNFKRSKL
ncbi:hypothetical protein PHSC3_001727 [Chlamydiales bacterium STE3]|nr:hypothetical protein PHSC3_001727 [Chlamydiales bacterium STE3]